MRPPDSISQAPRAAVVWPESAKDFHAWLDNHPYTYRIYLLSRSGDSVPTRDPRVVPLVFSDTHELLDLLSEHIRGDPNFFVEARFISYIAPAHAAHFPELKQQIDQRVLYQIKQLVSSAALRAYRGWHMLSNSLLNIERICAEPTIETLRNAAAGATVVVVGAGPSLDDNIDRLAEHRERVLVIACDGAWKSLSCAGMAADLVVTTDDSERVWRYFAHAFHMANPPPVACLQQSSWPVVRHYPGRLLFGTSANTDLPPVTWFPDLPTWDTGLCVGHAALECAWIMNPERIVLMGFDLGYKRDAFHPKNQPMPYYHHAPPPAKNMTTVPGIDGRPVKTELSMAFYLEEFVRRIATHNTPVWDATEGGAKIEGTRIATLVEALTDCPLPEQGPPRLAPPQRNPPKNNMRSTIQADAEALMRDCASLNTRLHELESTTPPLNDLAPHRALLDILASAQNPLQLASLQFAWLDWQHAPHDTPKKNEFLNEFRTYLSDLSILAKMTHTLSAMNHRTPPRKKNVMLVSETPFQAMRLEDVFSPWKDCADTWLSQKVTTTRHLSAIWEPIIEGAITTVITLNGGLTPAEWGMPGCTCLDFRTAPPDQTLLHEQWLPGYAVITDQPDLATSWRNTLPADCPVYCIIDRALYRIDTDNTQTPMNFPL
ncbi:MAG: DUF115 domain-containing protein [Spartobacteria bacterium]|nr:DUF115 domain-containing protein [Spartobacteria bacterium]